MDPLRSAEKLGSARRTLRNAMNHLQALEAESVRYLKSSPLERRIEIDSKLGHEIHKLVMNPLPELIEQAAFDLVNNLRSALDQACCAIAIASGGDGKKAHFPFGKNLDDVLVKKKGNGGSKNIPDEIFSLILEIKPYKDGDLILWELNNLCNNGKHEIITPIAGNFSPVAILTTGNFESPIHVALPPTWNFERQEMVLAIIRIGSKHEYEFKLFPYLAIGGNSDLRGGNAIEVFAVMHRKVQSILDLLEEKMTTLGL